MNRRGAMAAELERAAAELRRLHRAAEQPRTPVVGAVLVTILLALWGNAVVLWARRTGEPDLVTLVAHPAAAVLAIVILLRRKRSRRALGLDPPRPEPDSRLLRLLLTAFSIIALVAVALGLALDPTKRLDLLRLVAGTAAAEEVLHRGALLAVWTSTPAGPVITTVANVVAFGAWHVAGAFHHGGAFHPLEVVVPAFGALLFLWARLRYRSVAAPIVLHLATNLPGTIFGL